MAKDVENPTEITVPFIYAVVDKYIDEFVKRFPELIMNVYFTPNGQPPIPTELWDAEAAKITSGRFLKVSNEYRIGINNDLILPAQLMTFFHEYGHAVYSREADEAIDNRPALIRTETAAILSSLRLSDKEGLPEIAYLSIYGARQVALRRGLVARRQNRSATETGWTTAVIFAARLSLALARLLLP